jgi:hypothetical protein
MFCIVVVRSADIPTTCGACSLAAAANFSRATSVPNQPPRTPLLLASSRPDSSQCRAGLL